MSRPPVIGITTYARDGDPASFTLPCSYVDAVRIAGGIALALPPGEAAPQELLDIVDGLILAGGGDIAPAAYAGQPHETIYSVCEERDRFEFALARAALARPAFPLLCICRGMQVLNVVCGGTLHAHVPERFGGDVAHRQPPRLTTCHPVRVAEDSRLATILGTQTPSVCSWHHQAIDRLGQDLTAVAWADDGLIEAVEHRQRPHCVAVQWHPEMQLDDAAQVQLFRDLISAARPTASR